MGLFGHGGHLSKIGHTAEKAVSDVSDIVINKPLHEINKIGRKIFRNNSWYVGYNSNTGPIILEGNLANQKMGNSYQYNNIGKKPNTYKGNTAKTANSIKQGGMTKDDLITYNQKHPNETAGASGSMKTSLNSNTATTEL